MPSLRQLVKRVPGVAGALYQFRKLRGEILSHEVTFAKAFFGNDWSDPESVSGTGSSLEATVRLRQELPLLWRKYRVFYLVDAPCGDFNWMRHLVSELHGMYLGLDVVRALADLNEARYGTSRVRFRQGNLLTTTLPSADLLMCRDCLVHFSYRDIYSALQNIGRSGIHYFLTTTFPGHQNRDSITGTYWRPVNLEAAPFGFPPPLEMINEGCTEIDGSCSDKSLALWRMADLASYVLGPKIKT